MSKTAEESQVSKDKKPEKKEYSPEVLEAFALIKRGADEILPEETLLDKLERSRETGKPLIVKAGFDPTAPDLHLGHTVLIRKLKHFQDLGHEVHFLIGDFTGMIGDPTGRSATRVRMTREDVEKNAETYKEQVFKILDPEKTKVDFNSTWCADMKFQDVLGLTARYTVARMLERDDFSKRYAGGESISMIEFLYPLVQGYDSVAMKADIELGGTDQKFNLLVGRELQSQFGQEAQAILTVPLLVGLDGEKKMSKSYNNYIGINEKPYEMFAKTMSISDELMTNYYVLLTDIALDEIEAEIKNDPFEAKKKLGIYIADCYHPPGSGQNAREQWEQEKSINREKITPPPGTPEFTLKESMPLVNILKEAELEKSLSGARRLVDGGAIKIEIAGETLTVEDQNYIVQSESAGRIPVKIGKKRYLWILTE